MKRTGLLCPTCHKATMVRVTRDVRSRHGRRVLLVTDVDVDECPRCGERLYDLAALRRIRDARRGAGLRSAA